MVKKQTYTDPRHPYKFSQVIVRIRWVDWKRIRSVFPGLKDESAASYMGRLARWLQTLKGIGAI